MPKIDYDNLKRLESLLDDGVIDQSEYEEKVRQVVFSDTENTTEKQASNMAVGSDKSKILLFAVIALVVLSIVLGVQLATYSTQLQEANDKYASKTQELNAEIDDLRGYKTAVRDFYLDSAVLVIEGGGNVYHRYGCPEIPMVYTYWLYNVDAARDHGYRECSTCFGDSADAYCKKHIEY